MYKCLFLSLLFRLVLFVVTTDAARRKQPLSMGKGAKNIRASLDGNSRSRMSSQPALGEDEGLLWEWGEPCASVLMEGEGGLLMVG